MPTQPLPNLPHATLENGRIWRSWCVADGLATTVYKIRPREDGPWLDAMLWFPWWPYEAILTVDGEEMPISRFETHPEGNTIRGVFEVSAVRSGREGNAESLDFVLQPAQVHPKIEAVLHYRLIMGEPLLRSWLTIRNVDGKPHVVQRIAMEAIYDGRL